MQGPRDRIDDNAQIITLLYTMKVNTVIKNGISIIRMAPVLTFVFYELVQNARFPCASTPYHQELEQEI